MQPTTAHDPVARLRAGPTALLGVLAIVIVALAAGLTAVILTTPMP